MRLNGVRGVANVVSYMHDDYSYPLIHRDLISNNVLLNGDYEAHVSDFGTAILGTKGSDGILVLKGVFWPLFAFRRQRISPDQIVETAFTLANLQINTQQQESTTRSAWLNPNRTWLPPQQGMVKINVDGAFPTANQMGAIASIARDHTGSLIGGVTRTVSASSALEMEIQALLYTLKDLLQQHLTESHLVLESGSIILVETLNRCRLPPWECQALFAESAELLQSFHNLNVKHCCREANALVD
ncbi:probable serine/threonine-protein kinase PBL6 [Eucalyptus grandis]|uniref:probable serine/threonine-protein kinase PBL6 n=1 Tax=Eucalyptus grandis TaxID=71139 RepID=UPI00192EBFEE|nr:probable serine/threonine-protein kinase PBL6 [Eucalyptus grandis]